MKLECIGHGNYELRDNNGRLLNILTEEECGCVVDYFRAGVWRNELNDAIDEDEDYYDFSKMSREYFLSLCFEEIYSKREIYGDTYAPDFSSIVFSIAKQNGIWRD